MAETINYLLALKRAAGRGGGGTGDARSGGKARAKAKTNIRVHNLSSKIPILWKRGGERGGGLCLTSLVMMFN